MTSSRLCPLRHTSGVRVASFGALAGLLATSGAALAAEEWSYATPTGPEEWGGISSDYVACGAGRHQSPIDLTGALAAAFDPASLDWSAFAQPTVENNGHTIEVHAADGNTLTFDGTPYALLQFHFHSESEHTVDGVRFPMEVHFVHRAEDGNLAVLGVFVTEGAENPELGKVLGAAPEARGEAESEEPISPTGLLPGSNQSYLYSGSLTTPPCSEIVTWIVMADPIEVSAEQIAAFRELYEGNFRPVQPLNRRLLLVGG